MIIINAVHASGCFGYGFMPTIVLNKDGVGIGRVFLRGVNGSGKSSLPNIIKELLFGENETGQSGDYIINTAHSWTNGAFGALWFTRNSKKWRIILLRKWKGKPVDESIGSEPSAILRLGGQYTGTDLFLECWNGKEWVDERPTSIGNKTTSDVRNKILEVIGLTYDQFSAYVCIGQSAESALVQGTSLDREKVIQSIIDVSIWDNAADIVKVKASELDKQYESKKSHLQWLKDSLTKLEVQDASLVEHQIGTLQCQIQERFILKDAIQGQIDQIKQTQPAIDTQLKLINAEMHSLAVEERLAGDRLTSHIPASPTQELIECERRYTIAGGEIERLRHRATHMSHLKVGTCDKCGQTITAETLQAQQAEAQTELRNAEEQYAEYTNTWQIMKKAHDQRNAERHAEAKAEFDVGMQRIREARTKLQAQLVSIPNIQAQISQVNDKIRSIEREIAATQGQLASAQSNLKMVEEYNKRFYDMEQEVKTDEQTMSTLDTDLLHHQWVERNLRRMRLQEYGSAIIRLNQLLAEQLFVLCEPGIRAEFVTAQTKASGKGIKQGIDLLVTVEGKDSIPISMYSGGERKIVVIAVFRSIRKLMNERGCGIPLSISDELDKDLDDANVDKVVDAFEQLMDDSPTTIVISHNNRLVNTMKFDQIWTAEKHDNLSVINTLENVTYHQGVEP